MGHGPKTEWWTPQRLAAAKLASEGKSRVEISKELGIGIRTIGTWYASEEFNFKVDEFAVQIQTAMMKEGIRVKANRLEILQKQVDRMVKLADKTGGDEAGFDPKLSRELREYLKQAAIEMGDWTEKKSVEMNGNLEVGVKDLISKVYGDQDEQSNHNV